MADGLNRVFIMGYLGQTPELRVTSGGNSVLTLSVACNESWLDKNRVRQERVEWVRVTIWGRRAEALSKFLKKGALVYCEGKLQTSSWEDREGVKRYKTEVVALNVILGGGAKSRNAPDDPDRRKPNRREHYDDDRQQPPDRSAPSSGGGGYDDQDYGAGNGGGGDDDDIPF